MVINGALDVTLVIKELNYAASTMVRHLPGQLVDHA